MRSGEATPIVSVVIPTHRREKLLQRSLRSVLQQDYPELEIWVIDQDPTKRLIQSCAEELADARVRYVNLPNAGTSRAKNFGIERAQGEFLLFLDDDAHALTPSWVRSYVRVFQQIPEAGLVTGKILGEWPGEVPSWFPGEYGYLLGQYDLGDEDCPMPEGHLPLGGNMGGRTDLIRELGGFDTRFGYNNFSKRSVGGEDSLLGQAACKAGWRMY
ncbi:MAG: glycosyltransferase [Acidobacteria bacterium]|nr:glycosyltransferase [Acidobacteriota bacterium]